MKNNEGLFAINEEKEQKKRRPVQGDVYYTMAGREEYLDEGQPCIKDEKSENVFAKRKNNKQYILRNQAGNFINPIDAFDVPKPEASRNGNPLWSWVEVEPSTFDFYLRFLRTGNHTWLRQAERKL